MQALLAAIAKRESERERRAILRAGLVASTLHNLFGRRKGEPQKKPHDYVSARPGPPLGSPEWTAAFREKIRAHNQRVQ